MGHQPCGAQCSTPRAPPHPSVLALRRRIRIPLRFYHSRAPHAHQSARRDCFLGRVYSDSHGAPAVRSSVQHPARSTSPLGISPETTHTDPTAVLSLSGPSRTPKRATGLFLRSGVLRFSWGTSRAELSAAPRALHLTPRY